MSDRAFEEIKMAVVATFPEAYVWDTGRGGFDIIDVRDKDTAMSVGYGKTEFEAWSDAYSRQTRFPASDPVPVEAAVLPITVTKESAAKIEAFEAGAGNPYGGAGIPKILEDQQLYRESAMILCSHCHHQRNQHGRNGGCYCGCSHFHVINSVPVDGSVLPDLIVTEQDVARANEYCDKFHQGAGRSIASIKAKEFCRERQLEEAIAQRDALLHYSQLCPEHLSNAYRRHMPAAEGQCASCLLTKATSKRMIAEAALATERARHFKFSGDNGV